MYPQTATASAMAKLDPVDVGGDDQRPSKRAALSPASGADGGPDRISDLPDDILVSILAYLPDTRAAAQTSVLSPRWRKLWLGLSTLNLSLPRPDDSGPARAALAAHAAGPNPKLLVLDVSAPHGADRDASVSLLRSAEPRVSRELRFHNRCLVSTENLKKELLDTVMVERGAFELPCMRRATDIRLNLGFHSLALPQSGVFAALKVLRLDYLQFRGQCTMDNTMFPFLQDLGIFMARGLADLTIRRMPLVQLRLQYALGLRRLNVEAPALKVLNVHHCFAVHRSQQFEADIKVERLEVLLWVDAYHPSLVKFSEMPYLQQVMPSIVSLSGARQDFNRTCERILKHFSSIQFVILTVKILPELVNFQPLIEGISSLPAIEILHLHFSTERHVYGASVLHLLTMCTGIRVLTLILHADFKGQNSCPLHCACDPKPDWRFQNIPMKVLEGVQIFNFGGKEHEVDFVKQLLRIAPALRNMRIICHPSFAGREELIEELENFMTQERETPVEVTYPQWRPCPCMKCVGR